MYNVAHLRQRIKYFVEEWKHFSFRCLRDIVHAFARVVSDPSILVREAGKHRWYNLLQVPRDLLEWGERALRRSDVGVTYGSQGYGGRSQAYQASVSSVWLVYGIRIVLTQLIYYSAYSVVVVGIQRLPYKLFEPGRCWVRIDSALRNLRRKADSRRTASWSYSL